MQLPELNAATSQATAHQQYPHYSEPPPALTRRNYEKLPIWTTFSEVLRVTIDNFGAAMWLVLPWLFILCAICTGLFFASFDGLQEFNLFILRMKSTTSKFQLFLFGAAPFAAACFVGANLAVKWHRFILLEEHAPLKNPFRLEPQSFRYFLLAAAVGAVTMTINIIQPPAATPHSGPLMAIAVLLAGVYLLVLFTRVGLKLPGIAVDRHELRIADALTCSQKSFWRILAVLFLLGICSSFIAGLGKLVLMAGAHMGVPGLAVGIFGQLLVAATIWIIGITTLTVLYRYFVEV